MSKICVKTGHLQIKNFEVRTFWKTAKNAKTLSRSIVELLFLIGT